MAQAITDLIPELSKWNSGSGISVKMWINQVGRFDHALGYLSLFWPDFSLFDDCVLINQPREQDFRVWLTTTKGNRSKVEAVLNHLHLKELFTDTAFKPSGPALRFLGDTLKNIWACKLAHDFPSRRFDFDLIFDEATEDYEITFWQTRD